MKILICDEDEKYIEYLIEKIKSFPCDEELLFESYTETPGIARRIETENFDIAYLGAVIHGRNGFELGRMIHQHYSDCILFYVCEDYKYMHEVFRAYGFQMLLKTQEKLLASEFQRALTVYQKLHFHVLFHLEDETTHDFIPAEIVYIETTDETTTVITMGERYCGYFEKLKPLKQKLLEYHFFQMHPQYFVNMEHIELVRSGELVMDNGDCIPTSAMNREVIDDAIQSFMDRI